MSATTNYAMALWHAGQLTELELERLIRELQTKTLTKAEHQTYLRKNLQARQRAGLAAGVPASATVSAGVKSVGAVARQ